MFVAITDLASKLKQLTLWQKTPLLLTMADYEMMIEDGIKTLYIDTGRASSYIGFMTEIVNGEEVLGEDLGIDEEKYVLIVAQIGFYKRVQCDVNNIVSYSTDALSITSADKPYVHLQDTIAELEKERRVVFYKMAVYYEG